MRTLTLGVRLALPLASAVSLAACGSSQPAGSTGSRAANSDYQQGLAFASCMRSHGVPNFPDPTAGSNGGMRVEVSPSGMKVIGVAVNAPAFQAAQQKCRQYLPNGGHPQPLSASRRQALLNFSACMRSHGITNFPDPTFSGGAVGLLLPRGGGIDPQAPAFKSAQTACASYTRQAGLGPPPGSGP